MIKADKFESKAIAYWVNSSLKKNPTLSGFFRFSKLVTT